MVSQSNENLLSEPEQRADRGEHHLPRTALNWSPMLFSARPCADRYCVTANSSVVTSFVRRSLPASPTRSSDAWRRNVWTMNRARSSALSGERSGV